MGKASRTNLTYNGWRPFLAYTRMNSPKPPKWLTQLTLAMLTGLKYLDRHRDLFTAPEVGIPSLSRAHPSIDNLVSLLDPQSTIDMHELDMRRACETSLPALRTPNLADYTCPRLNRPSGALR
ncbi:hypothetical protein FS749_003870 [Ceratobasidium sp. UAMH 11750]|nr:hypothetical protein FS749_003870 [Ceratobasidium sp. UAMH 11750]